MLSYRGRRPEWSGKDNEVVDMSRRLRRVAIGEARKATNHSGQKASVCPECNHGRYSKRACSSRFHLELEHGSSSSTIRRWSQGVEDSTPLPSAGETAKIVFARYEGVLGGKGFINNSLDATIETVTELPRVAAKENLFSITMPCCCGKTTIAAELGCIDIDSCMGRMGEGFLSLALLANGRDLTPKVKAESRAWLENVRAVFKPMSFEEPTLLLVHDDLTGYMSGATKIGSCNLPMEYKNKHNASLNPKRRELIRLSDEIFSEMNKDGVELDDYNAVELYVIQRASRFKIRLNNSEFLRGIGLDRADKLHGEALVRAWRGGQVPKAYVERKMIEDRQEDARGFDHSINAWVVALSGGLGRLTRVERTEPVVDISTFLVRCDLVQHIDAMKIVRTKAPGWDKMIRLGWWLAVGRYCSKSEVLHRLIAGIDYDGTDVFIGIGHLIRRSRFLFDVSLTDEDRVDLMCLCRMYGFRGDIELYKEQTPEKKDEADRVVRYCEMQGNIFLSTRSTSAVASFLGLEHYPKHMSTGDVARGMEGWNVRDAAAMFSVLRDLGDSVFLGKGDVCRNLLTRLIDERVRHLRRVTWSKYVMGVMQRNVADNSGVCDLVLEYGLEYLILNGSEQVVEVTAGDLEKIIAGEHVQLEEGTPIWSVAQAIGDG